MIPVSHAAWPPDFSSDAWAIFVSERAVSTLNFDRTAIFLDFSVF
jgi:hypothetical protein